MTVPQTLQDNEPLQFLWKGFKTKDSDDVKCIIHHDYSIKMHCHDFYEINLVLKGNGYHYLGGKRFEVKPGDFFVVPVGVKHGYVNVNALNVLHLLISQRFIEKNAAVLYTNEEFYSLFMLDPAMKIHYDYDMRLNVSGMDFDELYGYAENIENRQNSDSAKSTYIVDFNALSFILLALLCYKKQSNDPALLDTKYTAIRSVMQYIFEHYDETISVNKLAEIAGYSRANFFRFFKKLTSMTPNDFINMYRVNVARDMLTRGEQSLTEIALSCGFYDMAHFSHIFKKTVGTSPSKSRDGVYRKLFH